MLSVRRLCLSGQEEHHNLRSSFDVRPSRGDILIFSPTLDWVSKPQSSAPSSLAAVQYSSRLIAAIRHAGGRRVTHLSFEPRGVLPLGTASLLDIMSLCSSVVNETTFYGYQCLMAKDAPTMELLLFTFHF